MAEYINRTGWTAGANNKTTARNTPEGFVRESTNLVATPEGTLRSRPSIAQVTPAQAQVTAACAYDGGVLYADGSDIRWTDGGSSRLVAALPAAGANGITAVGAGVYVSTPGGGHYLWNGTVLPWAPRTPHCALQLESGGLEPGKYKVAVITTDAAGRTSGAAPVFIDVGDGQAIRVTGEGDVFVSPPGGTTMYRQGRSGGSYLCSRVYDDGDRITTEGLHPLPASAQLVRHNALLVSVVGEQLWVGEPFAPYLCDPSRGFFLFEAPITNCISCGGGLFVTADKTYFISGVEGPEPQQTTAWGEGAVAGTSVELPDGNVAWFSQRGLVMGTPDGQVRMTTDAQYAPRVAPRGVSGYIDAGGVPTVVTAMQGNGQRSIAATRDQHDLEIIRNEP